MKEKSIATFTCEVIPKEFVLVGQSITANYPHSFPEVAIKVQMDFIKQIEKINNCQNKQTVISPYMCNDIVATYFACVAVEELRDIPEGMIGFTLPLMNYAKISCTNKTIDQGYSTLFSWMDENGYKQKWFDRSFPIEIFYLEEGVEEEKVDILIPIQ